MPFGLTNAPATFQSYINYALRRLVDKFYIVYLDNVLIFSRSKKEYLSHYKAIIQRL